MEFIRIKKRLFKDTHTHSYCFNILFIAGENFSIFFFSPLISDSYSYFGLDKVKKKKIKSNVIEIITRHGRNAVRDNSASLSGSSNLANVFVQIVPVGRIIDFHMAQSVVPELTGRQHVFGRIVVSATGLVLGPALHRFDVAANHNNAIIIADYFDKNITRA